MGGLRQDAFFPLRSVRGNAMTTSSRQFEQSNPGDPFDQDDPNDRPDALRQDAHAWVGRLASGKVTQWEAQAFQRWRAASPRHQAAFEEARDQWRLLGPAIGNLLESDAGAADFHRRMLQGLPAAPLKPGLNVNRRRIFLGAAVSAAAAAGVAAIYPPLGLWPAAGEWGADYRTAAGEQRVLTLADEVNVTMNTRTSIRRVALNGRMVGLDLLEGEAAVELQAARPPFSVAAGAGRSLAEAGRFEVRYLDGKVCVTCIEGTVRVVHPAGERLLQARQQTIYDAGAVSGVAAVDPSDVSAWRRGELVFRQAPLFAVIDELNRYRPGRIVLMASSLRNNTVSARFQLAALDTALLQIQRSFDLTARALPGGVLVLS
jgi:transmembrane sensor